MNSMDKQWQSVLFHFYRDAERIFISGSQWHFDCVRQSCRSRLSQPLWSTAVRQRHASITSSRRHWSLIQGDFRVVSNLCLHRELFLLRKNHLSITTVFVLKITLKVALSTLWAVLILTIYITKSHLFMKAFTCWLSIVKQGWSIKPWECV